MKAPWSAKYRRLGGGLLLALALALGSNAMAVEAQQQIRLVGDPWPPYVNGELGEQAESGIAVEILRRIFAQVGGVELVFPLIPWKRALIEVEHGQSDGIAMLLKTAERERYLEYSVPLLKGYNLLWYLEQPNTTAFSWNSYDDLNGLRIGVVENYSYGIEVDARFASGAITAIRGPTVRHLFAMLSAGRVDLIMSNDAVGYTVLGELGDSRIRAVSKPVNNETFYFGMSKRSPAVALMPQIDAAIIDLQQRGIIDRLVRGEIID